MSGPAPTGLSDRLRGHPFFGGMDPGFLEGIGPAVRERRFEVGDVLLREGAPANDFVVLLEGKVALELVAADRPVRTIQTVGPGEVLGWSWLLPGRRWSLDAVARKAGLAAIVPAETLRSAFARDPAVGYRFLLRLLPVVAERLDHARLQLLDLQG